MNKQEFNKRVTELNQFMCVNENPMERVNDWFGTPINVFQYAATSEANMERMLRENTGRERQTTFMADLSMGEWYGRKGVIDTCKNALRSWKDSEVFMAEFVLCVNWKSWEHHARGNSEWMKFYSLLYEFVRDLVYDYYEGDEKKTSYVWRYLD